MPRVPRLVALATAVLVLAGGAQALARGAGHHALRFHHRALTVEQIRRDARMSRVIVVLSHQQRGRLATASSVHARRAVQARQRRPLLASIARSGGSVTRSFTVLNAFSARV